MPTNKTIENQFGLLDEVEVKPFSRRKFLGYVGATSAILATAGSSCKKDPTNTNNGVNLGSGDTGILNYAYALEQLEAAFYTMVVASQYSGITAQETAYLTDIRNHEVAHREFFKAALGSSAIPALQVTFASVNFGSRASVLGTAKAFEDLGVSAYNGAGQFIVNPDYLTAAGKIVSVEARHAALIRELLNLNSFADNTVVDAMGLDVYALPPAVLAIAGTYIVTKIDASHLPS
ncbi:MAG: ferritin-like domain-containing protein [Chitinophagaceae bacterium]|nr:ferritin-like domain-containing protein [Chitinophagaceae bacterium]HEV8083077.1 ferritin-like domain-containing protein [Chitinophagaceae bacterium]